MANDVSINIDLITRQAQANAEALSGSVIGLNSSLELLAKGFEIASRAIAPFVGAFSDAIKNSIEFEAKIAEISTLFQSGFNTEKTRKELLDLSSAFGLNQADVAKGYYDTISAGITDAADASKVLEAAAKLATGGLTSQATAITGLTNIIKGYALDVSKTAEITDVLFIGAQVGKTTIDELSQSIGQVSPLAKAAGVSFQETVAAMSALTLSGKTTSEATTGLRSAIENLIRPNKDMEEALKRAGIASVTASLQTEGLTGVFKKLVDVSGGTTEGLGKIFGSVEGLQAVLSLAGPQAQDYGTALKMMGDAAQKAGNVTDEAVNKMKATAEFQLRALASSFQNLGVEIVTSIEPSIAKMAEFLTSGITNIKEWVRENEASFNAVGQSITEFIDQAIEISKATIASEKFQEAVSTAKIVITQSFDIIKEGTKEVGKIFEDTFKDSTLTVDEFKTVLKVFASVMLTQVRDTVDVVKVLAEGFSNLYFVGQQFIQGFTQGIPEVVNIVKDGIVAMSNLIASFLDKLAGFTDSLSFVFGDKLTSSIKSYLTNQAQIEKEFGSSFDRVQEKAQELSANQQRLAEEDKKRQEENAAAMKKVMADKTAISAEEAALLATSNASKDYYAKQDRIREAQETEAKNKAYKEQEKAREAAKKHAEEMSKLNKKLADEGWAKEGGAWVKEYGERLDVIKEKEEKIFVERKENTKDTNKIVSGEMRTLTEFQLQQLGFVEEAENAAFYRRIDRINEFVKQSKQVYTGITQAVNAFDTSEKTATEEMLAKAGTAIAGITQAVAAIPGPVGEIAKTVGGIAELAFNLPSIIAGIPDVIKGVVTAIPVLAQELIKAVPSMITALVEQIPTLITRIIESLPQIVTSLIELLISPDFYLKVAGGVFKGLIALVTQVPDLFTGFAIGIYTGLQESLKDFADFFLGIGSTIWTGVSIAAESVKDFLYNAGRSIWDGLKQGIESVGRFFEDLGSRIWNGLSSGLSSFDPTTWFGGGGGGGIGEVLSSLDPTTWFANGGLVPGVALTAGDSARNDIVPAMLSPGELIIPRSAVAGGLRGVLAYAADALSAPQRQRLAFATGGMVGGAALTSVGDSLSLSDIVSELRNLRSDMNAIGFATAKNTMQTQQVLTKWDVDGLPSDRGY